MALRGSGARCGRKKLEASGGYEFASGMHNPDDAAGSGAFDSLYAANHDKFGHQDLLAWRNIHNFRALAKHALWESLFSRNTLLCGYRALPS